MYGFALLLSSFFPFQLSNFPQLDLTPFFEVVFHYICVRQEKKGRRMPEYQSRPFFPSRPEGSSPYVTSAVGIEETQGRVRARRSSLFTRTVIWITGLICLAFLLGSLAQAWSNSALMQRVDAAADTADSGASRSTGAAGEPLPGPGGNRTGGA